MSRHVRITLEGVATCVEGGKILRTRMGGEDGPLVLISQAWPGVTVEDVTPERQWTDGDVVQGAFAWDRRFGEWVAALLGGEVLSMSDADVSADVANGTLRVLRYQAGE